MNQSSTASHTRWLLLKRWRMSQYGKLTLSSQQRSKKLFASKTVSPTHRQAKPCTPVSKIKTTKQTHSKKWAQNSSTSHDCPNEKVGKQRRDPMLKQSCPCNSLMTLVISMYVLILK